MVPSGRRWNHSGCSRMYGWSGEHWKAMSSATSMPRSFAELTKRRKSSRVPSCGWIALCPPSGPPMAHGLPTSSGPAVSVLFLPLRAVRPIGWMGGRYTTSNPSSPTYGRILSASRTVPGRDAEGMEAVGADRELRLPSIVAEEPHRLLARLALFGGQLAPADHGREVIVALLEDVGGDADRLAGLALDRIAPAVDMRLHVCDDRAPP